MEKNYAGFADKVGSPVSASYLAFSQHISKQTANANTNYCVMLIYEYLAYFKDMHVQFGSLNYNKNEKDTTLARRISETEKIVLGTEEIARLKSLPLAETEGIYKSDNYTLALVKNKNQFRDYAAVIIESKNKFWKAGEVKMELKATSGDSFRELFYNKYHYPELKMVIVKNGRLDNDYSKEGVSSNKINTDAFEPFKKKELSNKVCFYENAGDSISYLRIKSFDQHFAAQIKQTVEKNYKQLTANPFLIIDLRFNGGGSDFSYEPLRPLLYTQPVKMIGVDVFSTPDNIIAWQRLIDENWSTFPAEQKKNLENIMKNMKSNTGKFINIADDQFDTLKQVLPNPRKVVILIDGECGSTTEQFLLEARQSKKVILAGTHTAGVLDYSNLRQVKLPCLDYILGYSTTRSRRIPTEAIDNVGIKPNVEIDFEKPWFEEVKKLLN